MINKICEHIRNRDFKSAERFLVEYLRESRGGSIYWNLMGYMYEEKGEVDVSIAYYAESVKGSSCNLSSLKKCIELGTLLNKDVVAYKDLLRKHTDLFNVDIISYISQLLSVGSTGDKFEKLKTCIEINSKSLALCVNACVIENNDWQDLSRINSLVEYDKNRNILVLFDANYMRNIELLAKKGIDSCYVLVQLGESFELVLIDKFIMDSMRDGDRKRTVTMHMYNSGDSNVYAMKKYMPTKYSDGYKINMIYAEEYAKVENIVKTPLISSVYISGHGTFFAQPYPWLMYNFEVGHGAVSFKACGSMNPDVWYASPQHYKDADKVCVTSVMDMVTVASFSGLPRDKYLIAGYPRTDTLVSSNGKKNLEKLLGVSIEGKKVIFNLPTFHHHEKTGRLEGNKDLNGFIKMKAFDYGKFNKFLQNEGYICITKVHYLDEKTMGNKKSLSKMKNIHAFSNLDLEKHGLDLYEILNATDVLITDYSSVYGDFLFMDKPTVFLNSDIEEYRQNRGLVLEPYDFWTAGAKVDSQCDLECELKKAIEVDEYKEKRASLRTVYHAYLDGKSTERAWDYIVDYLDSKKEVL